LMIHYWGSHLWLNTLHSAKKSRSSHGELWVWGRNDYGHFVNKS
jgi:hypothetical protein